MTLVTSSALAQTSTVVTAKDGTKLATTVWMPPNAGTAKRPSILRRTPYGRTTEPPLLAQLLQAGVVVVAQDVRGRYESGGDFFPFLDDGADGADAIAWITSQPWSNGVVASYGASADGITQLMALREGPPALKCALPAVATDDLYEAFYPGGAWRTELGTNWMTALGEPEGLRAYLNHEARDSYWERGAPSPSKSARIKATVRLVTGFYDIFAPSISPMFRRLQEASDPSVRGEHTLIIGPWTHGGLGTKTEGDVTYPDDAVYTNNAIDTATYLAWCVLGTAKPTFPAVRYYLTEFGGDGISAKGEWRDGAKWPPLPVTSAPMYLQGDGSLTTQASAAAEPAHVPFDSASPLASVGGGNLTTPAGPRDQRAVDANPGVVTFTTKPAEAPVDLVGDPTATIWAASSTSDADVVVRIEVVTQNGPSLLVTDGIRRGRFREGYEAPKPLTPNVAAPFEVPLGPMAIRLAKGQSLRVAVSASSAPRYSVNPGKGTLSIYRDGAHASVVTLPLTQGSLGPIAASPTDGGASPSASDGSSNAGGCGCTTVAERTSAAAWIWLAVLFMGKRLRRRQ